MHRQGAFAVADILPRRLLACIIYEGFASRIGLPLQLARYHSTPSRSYVTIMIDKNAPSGRVRGSRGSAAQAPSLFIHDATGEFGFCL